jgi:hypothetical protein
MGSLRRRPRRTPAEDPEINRALEAMSAPELRAAVHAVLGGLDADVKAHIIETLIARATKATSGWRPGRPPQRIVDEAKSFAEAARRTGSADPDDVSEHLRRATKAFHAGDHASARAVFEAILPPIAAVDIDLGQHELVEDVLVVDAHACVAQYVARVFTTTTTFAIERTRCFGPSNGSRVSVRSRVRSRTWRMFRPGHCQISVRSFRSG